MKIRITGGTVFLTIPYHDKEKAKSIPGKRWNKNTKEWSFSLYHKDKIMARFPWTAPYLQAEEFNQMELTPTIGDIGRTDYQSDIDLSDFPFYLSPMEHQTTGIKYIIERKTSALLWEMGLGKTKAAIDAARYLLQHDKVHKILVICPKTLIENWQEEIGKNAKAQSTAIIGTRKKRLSLMQEDAYFHIINYAGISTVAPYADWEKYDMVILDESHKIKNHAAKRTKLLTKLFADRDIYKVLLTGTPITNNPLDIYSQYKFLDKKTFKAPNFYAFRARYCEMGGYGGYEILGYKHTGELREKIAAYANVCKKTEALDLPEKTYTRISLDMSREIAQQYRKMYDDLSFEIGNEKITATVVLTKMLRLQEVTAGAYIEDKDNLKLEALADIIEGGGPIVVFARFRRSVEKICGMLKKKKIPYSCIYGGSEDRAKEIKQFQDGETQVFVGSLDTCSTGITLTRANTCVYYENSFKMTDRTQSEDRLHRIGQKNTVQYIDIVYKGTIDEDVLDAIKKKQSIATTLVNSFDIGQIA